MRARERAEDAERRGERVAAALDRQLGEVGRIEVEGVRGEARAARVLDALVDRKDAHVAGAAQAAVAVQLLQVAQHLRVAVGLDEDALDEVGPRQMQVGRVERLALVVQQAVGLVAEELLEARAGQFGSSHGSILRFALS